MYFLIYLSNFFSFSFFHSFYYTVLHTRTTLTLTLLFLSFYYARTYVLTSRDHMRRVLKLPSFITIEYKKHEDSLLDKSSYRNPSVVWRAPATTGRQGGTLRLYLHLSILLLLIDIGSC